MTGAIQLIVAGHTHEPGHVALRGLSSGPLGEPAYFLDCGTWRTRIDAGIAGAFGRLRSYTMVFCYHDTERRERGGRRFESWTGHMQSGDYGAKLARDVTPARRLPRQRVRFVECRIQHVDEGQTADGGELALSFGVDGESLELSFEGVHDGASLRFPSDAALSADPALDGEVWCYGVERDLGDSALDRDDPMPWAVSFLPRVNGLPAGAFAEGPFELRAVDNRGNAFTLVGSVS
jgi:hypothetical protein